MIGGQKDENGGSGSLLLKNKWEWFEFIEKWNRSKLLKNGWNCVVFVETWSEGGRLLSELAGRGTLLLKNGWEWVVFLENWVGVGFSC